MDTRTGRIYDTSAMSNEELLALLKNPDTEEVPKHLREEAVKILANGGNKVDVKSQSPLSRWARRQQAKKARQSGNIKPKKDKTVKRQMARKSRKVNRAASR